MKQIWHKSLCVSLSQILNSEILGINILNLNFHIQNYESYFLTPVELQLLAQLSSSIIEDCCCSESELFGQFADNVWIRGSIGGIGEDAVNHKLRSLIKHEGY